MSSVASAMAATISPLPVTTAMSYTAPRPWSPVLFRIARPPAVAFLHADCRAGRRDVEGEFPVVADRPERARPHVEGVPDFPEAAVDVQDLRDVGPSGEFDS